MEQLNGTVGVPLALNSADHYPATVGAVSDHWKQVFPHATELDYVTNFAATLNGSSQSTATVLAGEPGNYRFEVAATMAGGGTVGGRTDVLVTDPTLRKLAVTGVIFGDLIPW